MRNYFVNFIMMKKHDNKYLMLERIKN